MVIPEEEYKNLPKIKPEVLKLIQDSKENLWLHIKTPIDLWNYGLDSKFEVIDAISASFPIHDTGFLGALRVASIHKSLVLRKFEKYVASYVIGAFIPSVQRRKRSIREICTRKLRTIFYHRYKYSYSHYHAKALESVSR
jgi:hypothetical protein